MGGSGVCDIKTQHYPNLQSVTQELKKTRGLKKNSPISKIQKTPLYKNKINF